MRLDENPSAIRWHIVNRNLHPGFTVREKLSEKIAALAKLLVQFPPDSVHLQVVLDKLEKKGLYDVRLTLRLPSNTLHAEKTGTDLLVAINTAIHALKREVMSLKAELRGDYRWKRPARRAALKALKESRHSSSSGEDGAAEPDADFLAQIFAAHHATLLAHAGRLLRMAELTGILPSGQFEPGDVVDEVARLVLDPMRATPKPARMSYQQWFFRLVQDEVDGLVHRFAEEMRLRVVPDMGTVLLTNKAKGNDGDRPMKGWQEIEPDESLAEERLADDETVPPDVAIAGQDLVEYLQQEVKTWPSLERQIFELHYLVGLEVGDIAMIVNQPPADIQGIINQTQLRLRDFLRRAVSALPHPGRGARVFR